MTLHDKFKDRSLLFFKNSFVMDLFAKKKFSKGVKLKNYPFVFRTQIQ
jgi:hypothetical protein